jgi:hypothetical protein
MKIGIEGTGVISSKGKHKGVVAPIHQTTADMIRLLEIYVMGCVFEI